MPRHNLQQTWPEDVRQWVREKADAIGASDTDYLVALVKRERAQGEEIAAKIDPYLPPPSPRSRRGKAERAARKALEAPKPERQGPTVPPGRPRKQKPLFP